MSSIRRSGKIGCLGWCVLAVIGLVFLGWLGSRSRPPDVAPPVAPAPSKPTSPAMSPKPQIHIGDLVVLNWPQVEWLGVAPRMFPERQLAYLARSNKTSVALEVHGAFANGPALEKLIKEGEVWVVDNGLQAEVCDTNRDHLIVRMREGPLAGELAWIARRFVKPWIEEPKPPHTPPANDGSPPAETPRKIAPPVDSTPRAKSLLKMARNLEQMGNTKGALEFYRNVVKQAPDSAEGQEAKRRVKAIEEASPSGKRK